VDADAMFSISSLDTLEEGRGVRWITCSEVRASADDFVRGVVHYYGAVGGEGTRAALLEEGFVGLRLLAWGSRVGR